MWASGGALTPLYGTVSVPWHGPGPPDQVPLVLPADSPALKKKPISGTTFQTYSSPTVRWHRLKPFRPD